MNRKNNDKNNKKDRKEKVMREYEEALMGEAPEACAECGGSLKFERVNLEDYEGGKLYVIEDVPAFVCEDCGEIWVPKPFLDEFEKMIDTVKKKRKGGKTR